MNISPPDEVDTSAPLSSHNDGELVVDRSEAGLSSNSKGATAGVELKTSVAQTGELSAKLPPSLKGLQKDDLKESDKQTFDISKHPSVEKEKDEGEGLEDQQEDPISASTADVATKPEAKKRRARKKWKKPKDKPNRPLSAYNLFFQSCRQQMLGDVPEVDKAKKRVHRKTHGKVGFAEMARSIGAKWKNLPPEERKPFEEQAAKEKKRYESELDTWKKEQKRKSKNTSSRHESSNKGSSSYLPVRDLSSFPSNSNAALDQRRLSGMNPGFLQQHQQQQYPRAAEASASVLLNQFQQGGMPGIAQQNAAQAQAQLLELQQQQMILQHQQQRLLELQRQMNMNRGGQQNQGNLDTSINIQQRISQQPTMQQQSTGGGGESSGQQGLGIQQQQQRQHLQFGGGQNMDSLPPQFTGNMAEAMMRLQRRYGM